MPLIQQVILIAVFTPLFGAVLVGFYPKRWGQAFAHRTAILAVLISFLAACFLALESFSTPHFQIEFNCYQWGISGEATFPVGFYVDRLACALIWMVSFVSLMVHIYTVGYLKNDPGYARFFSYIAFFTFAMLLLVSSNNFLQLFFGWEGVGLASYLLIGFWFDKPSATQAGLKAFLLNRIGDLGFLMGIAGIFLVFHSLEYTDIFKQMPNLTAHQQAWLSGITLSLFIGAMGKSAQMPLHVWLPDSMEGPTPISALIHAATMVTAGVFMVARFAPLFEQSALTLNVILMVGSLTCLLMGILAIVQTDLKRIIAYSTLSQLGLMMVAVGSSNYSAGIFHLITHAFFKALLFLAAGAVILALNHEQNINHMGGLRKKLPIPCWTMFIGILALIGFPGFSGFYSKDLIFETVIYSKQWFAPFAYYIVLASVFLTALYSFRLWFLVFCGQAKKQMNVIQKNPLVINGPLVILAILSIFSGVLCFDLVLQNYLNVGHPEMQLHAQDPLAFFWHGFFSWPFVWMCLGGLSAWYAYLKQPKFAMQVARRVHLIYCILVQKYGFDILYDKILVRLARFTGNWAWRIGDQKIIEGILVHGLAKKVQRTAQVIRKLQAGWLDQYVFFMILAIMGMVFWMVNR